MKVRTVAVLHQGREGAESPTLLGALKLRDRLCQALGELGLAAEPVYLDDQFQWVAALQQSSADLIFNAADLGYGYDITLEPHTAAVLEWIGRPFTGSGSHAGLATGDKYRSKVLLEAIGVPTPRCYLMRDLARESVSYPLILKSRYGHNSEGISDKSVVYDGAQLAAALDEARASGRELIAEEYIDGSELSAGFLGTRERRVLPFFTIEFGEVFAGRPKILGFTSKWEQDSIDYLQSMPALRGHSPELTEQVARDLLRVADLFQMNDYGRCDFRIRTDAQGRQQACVIDINTNPDINSDAGLFRMAATTGMSYPQFIAALIDAAMERYEDGPR